MSRRAVRAGAAVDQVRAGLGQLRHELEVPVDYEQQAVAEAERVAATDWTQDRRFERRDLLDVPFVTLDPASSRDLDQAFHLAREDGGYLVRYAIADVAAFVEPGGALDAATRERGLTYYGPDGRYGLHPPVLSEGAASLLPDVVRPAVVWSLGLDADGVLGDVRVERALVRSRAKLSYVEVQRALDDGTAEPMLRLLAEIGLLRIEAQIARGGATINVPEQEVEESDGGYRLRHRAPLPCEEYNAQLSLLTGIAAARLQRAAGVGLWRTLAPAREQDVARLRRVARGLGLSWPRSEPYGVFAQSIDTTIPAHAAFATEATSLFRGAGYVAFGTPASPEVPLAAAHSAIAAEYAHVTAPLRRLVDRFGTEIALAHCAGREVPEWVVAALDGLPGVMAASTQRANAYERGSVDLIEAVVLAPVVGRVFDAVVVESDTVKPREGESDGVARSRATVLLAEPAVRARVVGPSSQLVAGTTVRVRVDAAEPTTRTVTLSLT